MTLPTQSLIYLDHNATTPVDPAVREAMMPYLAGEFGNPSSGYPLGIRAREGVEHAREEVAALLGCAPSEVFFTSGGSESNNTVLKGVVDFRNPEKCHIITCAVEHPAVLNPCLFLVELGAKVTILPVDGLGRVDPEAVEKAIEPRTRLVSIMLANNETGTFQPLAEISRITRAKGVLLHTDAAQAVGKIPVDVESLGVDFLSVAGHKLYAPKGIGALYVREGKSVTPLIHGASQERGLRAGTENVVLAAGLGAACRVARERMEGDLEGMKAMRDRLQEILFEGIEGLVLNGDPEKRLPNTLNVSVPGLAGAKILSGLQGLMASTGAACHEDRVSMSHVLSAMKVPERVAMGTLRLTVGRSNSMAQVEEAGRMLVARVQEMRNEKEP